MKKVSTALVLLSVIGWASCARPESATSRVSVTRGDTSTVVTRCSEIGVSFYDSTVKVGSKIIYRKNIQ